VPRVKEPTIRSLAKEAGIDESVLRQTKAKDVKLPPDFVTPKAVAIQYTQEFPAIALYGKWIEYWPYICKYFEVPAIGIHPTKCPYVSYREYWWSWQLIIEHDLDPMLLQKFNNRVITINAPTPQFLIPSVTSNSKELAIATAKLIFNDWTWDHNLHFRITHE